MTYTVWRDEFNPPYKILHTSYSSLARDGFLVRIEMLERFAGAERYTKRWIFGDTCFNARAAKYELGEIAQLRRATRERDAVVDNIGGELRWSFL